MLSQFILPFYQGLLACTVRTSWFIRYSLISRTHLLQSRQKMWFPHEGVPPHSKFFNINFVVLLVSVTTVFCRGQLLTGPQSFTNLPVGHTRNWGLSCRGQNTGEVAGLCMEHSSWKSVQWSWVSRVHLAEGCNENNENHFQTVRDRANTVYWMRPFETTVILILSASSNISYPKITKSLHPTWIITFQFFSEQDNIIYFLRHITGYHVVTTPKSEPVLLQNMQPFNPALTEETSLLQFQSHFAGKCRM